MSKALAFLTLSGAVFFGCPGIDVSGSTCSVDSECKGLRVCEQGMCVPPATSDASLSDTFDIPLGSDAQGTETSDGDAQQTDAQDTDAADGQDGIADGLNDGVDVAEGDVSAEVATPDADAQPTDADPGITDADAAGETKDGGADATDATTEVEIPEPPVACPSFDDSFDAEPLSPLWTAVYPARIELVAGALELTVSEAPNDEFVRVALSLPEGFQGTTATLEVGSLASADASMRIWIQRLPTSLNQNTEISVSSGSVGARFNGAGGNTLLAKVDYDPTLHRWLRLQQLEGVMYYQTSADGVTFQTLTTAELPFELDDVNVAIAAANAVALSGDETVSAASFQLVCAP